MRTRHAISILAALIVPVCAQQARPGQNGPVVGYVHPAGGQTGTEVEITVGGLALGGTRSVVFSGGDLPATVLKHFKPINNQVENKIRELLKTEREKLLPPEDSGKARPNKAIRPVRDEELLRKIAVREGISEDDINAFIEAAEQRRDPKRQPNAQLAERLTIRVKIPADAPPGRREIRLLGQTGLSNPLVFMVGTLPESLETEPNDTPVPTRSKPVPLPATLTGRILPGDVDCFPFDARKGMKLTAAVSARELMPYLADAVPGWFQATVALLDANGREVAFKGSFDHRPDPLLCATVPADGRYFLQIRDSICRGREDFVYRITLGEIPCLTEQFPLGGKVGTKASVRVSGWNLSDYEAAIDTGNTPGTRLVQPRPPILGFMQFEAGVDPDFIEADQDNTAATAPWELPFPCTVNAIIRKPGERDRFQVRLSAGQEVVAEVRARRLGSPLDGMLHVSGPDAKEVAANDDCDDPASGLLTHHADPRVGFTAKTAGIYQFEVTDTQGKGGRSHAYRLTIAPPRPDFALRVTPSALNGRAGGIVPFTAHIVRRDGFAGPVTLELADPPPGYGLLGATIPAGKDSVQLSLRIPNNAPGGVHPLSITGRAKSGETEIIRPAQPADDRMQAFFYRHLVPANEFLVCVNGRAPNANRGQNALAALDRLRPLCAAGITVPAGGSATFRFPRPQNRGNPELTFNLTNPPTGITMTPKVLPGSVELVFTADATKVKPGQLGNLIVDVSAPAPKRPNATAAKGKSPLVKVGTLPPIPCRVSASPKPGND